MSFTSVGVFLCVFVLECVHISCVLSGRRQSKELHRVLYGMTDGNLQETRNNSKLQENEVFFTHKTRNRLFQLSAVSEKKVNLTQMTKIHH